MYVSVASHEKTQAHSESDSPSSFLSASFCLSLTYPYLVHTMDDPDIEKPLLERRDKAQSQVHLPPSEGAGAAAGGGDGGGGGSDGGGGGAPPPVSATTSAKRLHEKLRVPPINIRRPVVGVIPGHVGMQPVPNQRAQAHALSAVAAPLLQQGGGSATRPKSAPRERRTIKLPGNDLLLEQRRRKMMNQTMAESISNSKGNESPRSHQARMFGPSSGRITVYCIAEKFNEQDLIDKLLACNSRLCDGIAIDWNGTAAGNTNSSSTSDGNGKGGKVQWEGEVLQLSCSSTWTGSFVGDVFFFKFGVVVFWGFETDQEATVLEKIAVPCSFEPLKPQDVEDEEFRFQYTEGEKARIENDTIIMGIHHDSIIKFAICYPLAQSTKLKIYESRVQREVNRYIELPRTLATTGTVELSKKEIHMLIGTIFLEKCAVNLLTTVLDTPEFFWDASDALCTLYDAIFEYLEIADRVENLNARFEILEAMLDMLRDHQANEHSHFLEWIVIVLIIVEVVIGLVEILSLCGMLPGGRK